MLNRTLLRTITNVEEHIKNAFISETAHAESTFRSLKIDDATMEIKRQLDPEVLRQAAFFRDQVSNNSNSRLQLYRNFISVSRDAYNSSADDSDST